MLVLLIAVPLLGGAFAWLAERARPALPRAVALAALLLELALALTFWSSAPETLWLAQTNWAWIPAFGIRFHLGLDGLSLLLIVLTALLGIMAVAASWTEIDDRAGFFYFNLLWTLAGVVGVFLALDLFLFFFFWEVMLVPMYFVIALWGHERRLYAAIKFFIFTQVSGLLMLVAILALAFANYQSRGIFTFDYFALLGTPLDGTVAFWIMLGFFIAFTVKLPAVPFHTWLPDAHTEAPTGGSVILAGILLKTGAYGLLRFVVPLFPAASFSFAPVAMTLGVVGILYGAVLAYAQTDLKRLIAYSSVSHMGFVLVGVYAWNNLALQGVVMQMLAHGISTGALFMVAGAIQQRLHTRDLVRFRGLWAFAPRLAAIGLFFAIAALGLPGLGNFLGEFLVLFGAFGVSAGITAVAALGLVVSALYALILVQRAFHGEPPPGVHMPDFSRRETATMFVLIATVVWLGIYPQPMLNAVQPALTSLQAFPRLVISASAP
jgi:NADH-quinone oxidoreductase subunit M